MLHRFTILVRSICPRTRRCAVAVAACLLVLAATFCAVERPHIGWGPALEFNPVRMPEEESLSAAPEWLADVAETLVAEGYEHTILQVFSPGQAFGLVKPIDDMWEYHVRGYVDGRLESEIELSRRFFQHLSNTYRADASGYLVELLAAAGIDCVPDEPVAEPAVLTPPENPVSWAGLVLLSPVFQALISLDSAVHAA